MIDTSKEQKIIEECLEKDNFEMFNELDINDLPSELVKALFRKYSDKVDYL